MHDPSRVLLRRAFRVAIVLPLVYYFVVSILNLQAGGAYAFFGTFVLLAFSDFGGPLRDRSLAYLITGGVGLIAIVLGTAVAYNMWTAAIGTMIVGSALAYAAVLRGYVATANMSVLLPFVIAATSGPGGIPELPERLAGFAIGVVTATLAAVLLWPVRSRSLLRQRLADLLVASANVIRAMWLPTDNDTVDLDARLREMHQAHHAMREQYDGRLIRPGGATPRDRALMLMVDEATRLRIVLGWKPLVECGHFNLDRPLAQAIVKGLETTAATFSGTGNFASIAAMDDARAEHRLSMQAWADKEIRKGDSEGVIKSLHASFQLRLYAVVTEVITSHARVAMGRKPEKSAITFGDEELPDNDPSPLRILRSQFTLDSPWLRNSLRSGLALGIAVLFVYLSNVQHGFWVVLGTLTALRFDALGTGRTALQAIVGTCGGFIVGTGVLLLIGDNTWAYWVLFPIMCFLSGYTPGAISLMVGQASFTVMVIVFYGIVSGPHVSTGEIRVLDVGVGLAISLLVSMMMWPRGVTARVRSTLRDAVHASTALLIAAYDRMLQGPVAEPQVRIAMHNAQQHVHTAYETFDLAVAQSGPNNTIGAGWSYIANAAEHMQFCATWVLLIARSDANQIHTPEVAQDLIVCAHLVQTAANTAVDAPKCELNQDLSDTVLDRSALPGQYFDERSMALGGMFCELDRTINEYITSWANDPSTRSDTPGQDAIALVWAQDWLLHNAWIAEQMTVVLHQAAAKSDPGTQAVETQTPGAAAS